MNLTDFEHRFIRTFKFHFGENRELIGQRRFLLAVSGGADSVACAQLFHQFHPLFQYEFRLAHVHHGSDTQDPKQTQFRDESLSLIKELADKLQVEFVTNSQRPEGLKSEEEFRDFRYQCFKQWQAEGEILVLGHHLEDQLETQLMDLLRGSHFHHWEHFKAFHQGIFRPLSQCDKKDIVEYLKLKQVSYMDDPSNSDVDITRNWIRHELLAALEERFPKAKQNLSQNLKKLYEFEAEKLSDSTWQKDTFKNESECEIKLTQWMLFSYSQKQKFVLNSHLGLAGKSLTQGQINEVIKQLDQRQKDIKFQTGPIFWTKNAEKIHARREKI